MNENAHCQMIKDSVLFALSSGFSVSLFHFYLKKNGLEVYCSVFLLFSRCIDHFICYSRIVYIGDSLGHVINHTLVADYLKKKMTRLHKASKEISHAWKKKVKCNVYWNLFLYDFFLYQFCVCTSCNLSFNLFPVGSHVVEHFEVH